jgi:GT2 family glycosyltransferase
MMTVDAPRTKPPVAGADAQAREPRVTEVPRVLVTVVHWNGLETTTRCLESLQRLTYPRCHLLVVDNASTDGSGEILRQRFPAVEFHRTPENLLFAGGANVGLCRALSRGYDFAVVLNNDTEAAPDLLERLVDVAVADPRCGLVGPKIYYAERRQVIWSAGGKIDYWSGTFRHLGLRQVDGPSFDQLRDVDYLTGCCILARRQLLVDVGYLDTSYHMYSEDADWSVRARRAGYRVVFAPGARIWHRVSAASGGGTTPYKMYHRVRSNLLFLRRHARFYHWPVIAMLLPLHFLAFGVRELRRGNGRVVGAGLKALADLVRRAPRRPP